VRRMFRRHIRKTLAQEVPPILQEANFAFEKGEYGRAGELFERLGEKAAARGGPRAPLFYLQAGRARILAGQTSLGMPSLKRGLELLAQREQFSRLYQAATRVIAELNEHGLPKEAAEISAWLKTVLPSEPSTVSLSKSPCFPRTVPPVVSRCDRTKSNGWMR
jgi:hypothetical protein